MYFRIYLILAITIIFYGCETTTTQIKNENIKKTIDFVGNKKTESISDEKYYKEIKTDIDNNNELNLDIKEKSIGNDIQKILEIFPEGKIVKN